jgi:hypothetical protein
MIAEAGTAVRQFGTVESQLPEYFWLWLKLGAGQTPRSKQQS